MTEIINFFPHSIVRNGQDSLMEDLKQCFTDGKILLAHAPTGLGKTASSLTIAIDYALKSKKRIFFLTNRHTQHKIVIETIHLIEKKINSKIPTADLIGKRWMCNHPVAQMAGKDFNEFCKSLVEKGNCEFYERVYKKNALQPEAKLFLSELRRQGTIHNEELKLLGMEKNLCSYEIGLQLAKDALIVIADYNYIFNPFVRSAILKKLEIEIEDIIVIVDEGHNLPTRVMDMASADLSTFMLRNSLMEAKKFGFEGLIPWLQELNGILTSFAEFPDPKNREKLIGRELLIQRIQKTVEYEILLNELELATEHIREQQSKSFLGGIASFLSAWQGDDNGFTRILSETSSKFGPTITLSYSCLDPSIITRNIFSQVNCGIIMSGTLKPTFMYKDLLGIEKGVEKEYSSPFPTENKLSLIVPETSTKFTLRGEAMYQLIARKCSELSELIPGNVAFFFPSYDMRDQIGQFLETSKRQFWESKLMSKEEKEIFLNDFRRENHRGGVLLGVSGANFAEGIDLPGNFLNGVVVIGLPLAKPDLKTRELIRYYDGKFGKGWDYGYIYPAINKCLQSAGRCIRSETDRGAIIFMDERFASQQYFCCFPREGLMVTKEYKRLLREFFWIEGKKS